MPVCRQRHNKYPIMRARSCVYIYIYIYTYIYIYIYICIYAYLHTYMHTHIHIHTYTQLHTWRERATGKSIQRQTGKYARTRCGTVSHERIHVGFHAGVSRLDLFSKTICRPWTKARALLQPSARKIALTRTAAGGAIRDPCAAAAVPSEMRSVHQSCRFASL